MTAAGEEEPLGASARITIDLKALAANYALLRTAAAPAEVAAVVKADAYGLGIAPVAARLLQAGCRSFFVATLTEGIELRRFQAEARIFVLGGAPAGTPAQFARHDLLPVLNTLAEVRSWVAHGAGAPAALQIDTGMTRSGLSAEDAVALSADAKLRAALRLVLLISHLACADQPDHPMNEEQWTRFAQLRSLWPNVPWSLANSAGIFLGRRYHGDLVRPGIALYGGRPMLSGGNPMAEVVHLEGRVLQVRSVPPPASIGYGATYRVRNPARIAVVGVGYADGYPRALSGRGFAFQGGQRAPVVGRVSMDLLTVDVSAAAHDSVQVGDYVDLIGGGVPLEELAALGGTVHYELLTNLSRRASRIYR